MRKGFGHWSFTVAKKKFQFMHFDYEWDKNV